MKAITNRLLAPACALILPLCALAIWPVVEVGVCDEWSYTKSVQVLARTGHIVYNGWSSSIVGWQLYLGALFVKLFGFSFTTVRLSMLLVAMATAWIGHRILVRAGINEWNATVGVLLFVLSPLFLPLSVNFMTDLPSLFSIVLCLYLCLRAIQAETDEDSLRWLCIAAVSNAVTGTVRQIAWLGVLVMVPSTIWLLRRRRGLLISGVAIYLGSIIFIYGAMRWFHHQPYSVQAYYVPEPLIQRPVPSPIHGIWVLLMSVPEIAGLLLPLLLLFLPAVPFRDRRAVKLFTACSLLVAAYHFVAAHRDLNWLWPHFPLGSYVSRYGIMYFTPPYGPPRVLLSFGVRLAWTLLAALGAVSLITLVLLSAKSKTPAPSGPHSMSWPQLFVLLGPFTLAYYALLVPRAGYSLVFDRFFLPPLFVALLIVLRYYQERVRTNLPAPILVPIALLAAFGIAGTHDAFAARRAYMAAVQELRSAGVPVTQIDGGFEYNGWSQVEVAGFINDPTIPVLPGDHFRPFLDQKIFGDCRLSFFNEFAAIWPRYGLAVSPTQCRGSAGFAPVQYRTWLAPHIHTVYIVKVGREDLATRPGGPQRTVASR